MSGPIKTKIILSETVRDGEKIFNEKLKDYPYLNDPGMEDKKVQLDLLIRQGASDAFIETLFGDPEEMNADEIDIVRAFVRIAGERFFYDYLHHQSVSMKEAREFLRLHLFWMETLSGEEAEDVSISDWEGGGLVAFTSPAVIRGMKAELRREINEGMEKVAQQYTRNSACAFSSSEREEDLKKIIDILSKEVKEKDKWIKYMEEQRRDLRDSCENPGEPASGPEPKTGEKQCRDHQDGIGNARAPDNSSSSGPNDAGKESSLPGEEGCRHFFFMGKRTGRRNKQHLSQSTTAVLEEYRKARHSDE